MCVMTRLCERRDAQRPTMWYPITTTCILSPKMRSTFSNACETCLICLLSSALPADNPASSLDIKLAMRRSSPFSEFHWWHLQALLNMMISQSAAGSVCLLSIVRTSGLQARPPCADAASLLGLNNLACICSSIAKRLSVQHHACLMVLQNSGRRATRLWNFKACSKLMLNWNTNSLS